MIGALTFATPARAAAEEDDQAQVARLDLRYQAAVKRNDAATMEGILHPSFALVLGNGQVVSRSELLAEAKARTFHYDVQDEEPGTQSVRVWGDTAVVTALLHIRGTKNGAAFHRKLWFSDTYVRTEQGWKYAFAQASLPLPGATQNRGQ